MEKEIFEQAETIAQTMQGRVKITPLSPMKYAVPGIDPYLMPRVRMGGLVDHVSVSEHFGGTASGTVGLCSRWRLLLGGANCAAGRRAEAAVHAAEGGAKHAANCLLTTSLTPSTPNRPSVARAA